MQRILPTDPEAERAVLGSMMIDNSCIPLVCGILRASDFATMTNRAIFAAMERLNSDHEWGADPVTVLGALRGSQTGVTAEMLSEIIGSVPSAVMVSTYATQVKRTADQRNIITATRSAAEKAYHRGDPMQITAELHTSLEAGVNGVTHMGTMKDALDEFEATFNDDLGFLTGLVDLDSATGGVYPGVNLVTGLPGAGKTTLCVQIVLRALQSGHRVVMFSADQPRARLAAIMASQHLRIPISRLMEDKSRMRVLEKFDCIWYKGDFSYDRIVAAMKNYAAQGYDWTLIDYLSLVEVPGVEPHFAAEIASKAIKRSTSMTNMTALVVQSVTKEEDARGTMSVQHDPEQIWNVKFDKSKPYERVIELKKSRNQAAGTVIRLDYGGAIRRFYDEGTKDDARRGDVAGRGDAGLPSARREPPAVVQEQGLQPPGRCDDSGVGVADALMPGHKSMTTGMVAIDEQRKRNRIIPGENIGKETGDDDIPF